MKKIGQDETIKLRATCPQCGAKLEFYPNEVKTQILYDMTEYAGSYRYVICPVPCKTQIELKGK